MMHNKRFSYAPASSSAAAAVLQNDYPLVLPTNVHHSQLASGNTPILNSDQNSSHLLYRKAKDRNSLSLNHEFSHLYINKPNPNGGSKLSNFGTSQTKSFGRSGTNVDILPTLEEVQKHKRNAAETKKQMTQMEKSISFWCDCTDYWRSKWKKTKEDKRKMCEELRQLRTQVAQLQRQLKNSEEKRSKLSDKFHQLYNDRNRNQKISKTSQVHSSRISQAKQTVQESDQERSLKGVRMAFHDLEINEIQVDNHVYGQIQCSNTGNEAKIVLRNHERLLDNRINNKKRFSQVVMCDADDLFQMTQIDNTSGENTLQRNISSHMPEVEEEHDIQCYDYEHDMERDEERGFGYEKSEFEEEEEEDNSEMNISELKNVSLKVRRHLLKGLSGVSGTLETNSECVNVGSENDDQSTAIGGEDSTANDDDDDNYNDNKTEDEDDDKDKKNNKIIQCNTNNDRFDSNLKNRSIDDRNQNNSKVYILDTDKNSSDKKLLRNDSRDDDADCEDGDEDDDDEDDEV